MTCPHKWLRGRWRGCIISLLRHWTKQSITSLPITSETSSACSRELAAVTVHLPVGKRLTYTLLLAFFRQALLTYTPRPWNLLTIPLTSDLGTWTLQTRSLLSGWLRSAWSWVMSTLNPRSLKPRSNTPRMLSWHSFCVSTCTRAPEPASVYVLLYY